MCCLVEELCSQFGLGIGRLGDDQQSAGILVYTVNQSDTRVVRVVRRQVTQVPGNGIHQRTMEISHTWMHHQPSGFIDDHELVVLIYHIKRNVFGLNSCIVVRTIHHERHHIAWANLVVTFDGTVVDVDEASLRCFLYAVTRGVLQLLEHKLIDTHRNLPPIYLKAIMLIELGRLFLVVFDKLELFCVFYHSSFNSVFSSTPS